MTPKEIQDAKEAAEYLLAHPNEAGAGTDVLCKVILRLVAQLEIRSASPSSPSSDAPLS
jgi:hypothetical protein